MYRDRLADQGPVFRVPTFSYVQVSESIKNVFSYLKPVGEGKAALEGMILRGRQEGDTPCQDHDNLPLWGRYPKTLVADPSISLLPQLCGGSGRGKGARWWLHEGSKTWATPAT